MIETVHVGDVLYAIVVRGEYREPGVRFVTPGTFSQQLGFMSHPAGHRIRPHRHLDVRREVVKTQEVVLVRRGRLRVDFHDDSGNAVESRTLEAGDVVLLVSGGHGFEVLEDCDLVEVKQGPYMGDQDKYLYPAVAGKRPGTT